MISRDDYFFILEGLVNNQSIISLGDLIDMKIGVKCRECTEKLLNMNKNIDWRDLELIKKAKSNLYFSNIGTEHLQMQFEESKENNDSLDNKINIKEKPIISLKNNKTKEDNIPYEEKVKKILKECPNKYFKETIEKVQYLKNKEISDKNNINSNNNIPSNQSLTKKMSNLSLNNYAKDGKYKVPYSIEKSNYIKELEKYQQENADVKNKKKRNIPKSDAKIKKGKGRQKPEPTLLNIIASITQEKIDNDEELKEFKSLTKEEKENFKSTYYENTEEDITYGNVDLNEMKFDIKDEQNIIEKYNLIENNFTNDFQEQTPFYY
jgi:FtsZ-binding cell division protein ZapB